MGTYAEFFDKQNAEERFWAKVVDDLMRANADQVNGLVSRFILEGGYAPEECQISWDFVDGKSTVDGVTVTVTHLPTRNSATTTVLPEPPAAEGAETNAIT